ncbi:lipoyl(octanoyl) transferase LipB [Buchnera aphidicola (Formosaphis micheliae)]|uniref:lipoyl(octanoyl) transferase LipB n=1 Tax=Buchnera aphidicola TaxID=9 RepID=UPI0031CC540D
MYNNTIIVRQLGLQCWKKIFNLMEDFTISRNKNTLDELWCVQHYPIFTLGRLSQEQDLIFSNKIEVIQTNRGGRITYHGPGQQIIYLLIDINRRQITPRKLIQLIECTVLSTLQHFCIKAHLIKEYPGIYVDNKKICSFGLRITKGCSLHGFALNIDMDMSPFLQIYPCGNRNIKMTQLIEFKKKVNIINVTSILLKQIINLLNIKTVYYEYMLND